MSTSPWAGELAELWMLVHVPPLMTAYYTPRPAPSGPEPGVAEDVYKISAASFQGEDHLRRSSDNAPALRAKTLTVVPHERLEGGHP
jgi:hypothetical protein